MYQCLNCGEEFLFPLSEREIHYECDENPFEVILICPYCKDIDIEKEESRID